MPNLSEMRAAGARGLRLAGCLLVLGACLDLQVFARVTPEISPAAGVPGQVEFTPGTAKAINYRYLTGATEISFKGTVVAPRASGVAKVRARNGVMTIKARFKDLEPAPAFGAENLTYVLWAVTPAGRPVNLGEVIARKNGKAQLEARTNLQIFGLIVTAEPHFAVARVSNLMVLQNVITPDVHGRVEEIQAHYEPLPQDEYRLLGSPGELEPADLDRHVDPYVHQAYNAVRIARGSEAARYAPAEFQKALTTLGQLQAEKKKWKKPAILLARQVVQEAEDAHQVALARREQFRVEAEHQAAEQARQQAEAAQAQAEQAKQQAAEAARRAQEQAEQQTREAREQATREVSAEKLMLRRKLREQLNRLLETRETDRGLEISLSDLLFPSGKAALPLPTREKLAKISGILLAYPGLKVQVEGHADATGREAFNLRLSKARAGAVSGFLVRQGFPADAVASEGFGSSRPLASNASPSGRQQNRRVEIILSGKPIGF
jgi:outer membrane protein OmpA-like peptidoglycan-associated protein